MSITIIDICLLLLASWLVYKISFPAPKALKTTRLNGPPSQSLLLGCSKYLRDVPEPARIYEEWAEEYGPVYSVPSVFGSEKIMLHDPKALLHFYSREGFGYNKMAVSRQFIETLFGRNLLWAEGETHKRQRKSLTPAFANAAVRDYTSIFYDSAYKLTQRWDAMLESGSEGHSIIEVQQWMNRVSLDTIGLAGFSHDFQTLDGKPSVFDSIDWMKGSVWLGVLIIVGSRFPAALKLPSEKMRNLASLKKELSDIADHLFTKGKTQGVEDKSVIGLLMKAEEEDSNFHMSRDEVLAQMNLLLLAGYETTSISLTWCLIELCLNTTLQDRLREELSQFGSSDPTYEQLINSLPFLDAVVLETLRTHPPVGESPRVAVEDDIVPLSTPVADKSGKIVDSIFIAKGTTVCSPIRALNTSVEFWGADAKAFNPDRWLNGETESLRAKEIQGHRHILTFIDGPRTCLGKQFALVEFKAILSVLIRTYVFRLPGGKETEFGKHMGLLPRPKVMGMEGAQVPFDVRHV